MAHPFAKHAERKTSRSRVAHLMKSGGAAKHEDVAADKKLFHQMMAEHERSEMKMEGAKARGRYARGGKVNIAVVVPQRSSPPTPAAGPAGAAGPPPMAAPAPPMPMPMVGPAPPPPPQMKRGGKVAGGDASAGNLKAWSARAKKNSYARGGGLPTAGAETGVGRLQKAKK